MHPALSGQRELSQAKAPIGPYQPSERRPLGARYGGPKRLYQPQSEWEGGGHANLKGYCQILDFSHGQASSVHKTLTLCRKNLPLETYDTFSRRILRPADLGEERGQRQACLLWKQLIECASNHLRDITEDQLWSVYRFCHTGFWLISFDQWNSMSNTPKFEGCNSSQPHTLPTLKIPVTLPGNHAVFHYEE